MTDQNDHQYIHAVLAGNSSAFAVLVERYQHIVYTLASRMMQHREDAEEVAQDVFIKAYKKLDSFQGKSKFSTWLYRIAYNTCLDALSRKRKQPTAQAYEYDDVIAGSYVDSLLTAIEQKEIHGLLESCIGKLKEDEALLISLFYLKEQSVEELVEITGLTASNVKVKLHRSRKKIIYYLGKRYTRRTFRRLWIQQIIN